MIIPIEKGFSLVETDTETEERVSPRERFDRRAEEIARAAESHVRQMMQDERALLAQRPVSPGSWAVDPERRDDVPCGLKRRVVLRVPLFRQDETVSDELAKELRHIRRLMAQLALDLIAEVIEINRYFAKAGIVKAPDDTKVGCTAPPEPLAQEPAGPSAGKTMSGGNAGSSLRRRA